MSHIFMTVANLLWTFSFFPTILTVEPETSKKKFEADQGHDRSVKRFAVIWLPQVRKFHKIVSVAPGS